MDTTIILLPNESKKDICVTIKEDLTLEESEIFYCSLSISQGSEVIAQVTSSQAIVTIVDNDGKHKQSACAWFKLGMCHYDLKFQYKVCV